MKKWGVAIAVLTLPTAALADWQSVGTDVAGRAVFIDPASVSRVGNVVRAEVMTDYTGTSDPVEKTIATTSFDCRLRRSRITFLESYLKQGHTFKDSVDQPATAVKVGSIGEAVLNRACGMTRR